MLQVFQILTQNSETPDKLKFIQEEILKGNLSNLFEVLQGLAAATHFNVSLLSRKFLGRVDSQVESLAEKCTPQAPDPGRPK